MYVYIHKENNVWDVSSISAANIFMSTTKINIEPSKPGDAEQYTSGLNPKYRYIRYVRNGRNHAQCSKHEATGILPGPELDDFWFPWLT